MSRKSFMGLLLICLGAWPAALAQGAEWPTKPLTVIVAWAPGGMSDVSTRLIVEKFKEKLGPPVMVKRGQVCS